MDRYSILREWQDMNNHNMLCYSENYGMTRPKAGYEKQWAETKEKAKLIGDWIKEFLARHPDIRDEVGIYMGYIHEMDQKDDVCLIEFSNVNVPNCTMLFKATDEVKAFLLSYDAIENHCNKHGYEYVNVYVDRDGFVIKVDLV